MENSMELTPSQLLDYCITKLRRIPYNMENEQEISIPVKEVAMLLGKLKDALTPKSAEQTEHPEI